MSAPPSCQAHDEAVATHAVRLAGQTGLAQVCCECAVNAGRSCTH